MPNSYSKVRDACDRCHSKKLKCEKSGSRCERCNQAGFNCTYSPRRPYDTSRRAASSKGNSIPRSIGLPSMSSFKDGDSTGDSTRPSPQIIQWTNNIQDFDLGIMGSMSSPLAESSNRPINENDQMWKDALSSMTENPPFDFPNTPSTDLLPTESVASREFHPPGSFNSSSESVDDLTSVNISQIVELIDRLFASTGNENKDELPFIYRRSRLFMNFKSERYSRTFNAVQSMARFITLLGHRHGNDNFNHGDIQDSEVVLIVSCFLKIIENFDKIFKFWLLLLNADPESDDIQSYCSGGASYFFPMFSIGNFSTPINSSAQFRLIMEISLNVYKQMSESLSDLTRILSKRNRVSSAERITYVSDTILELAMGRERAVKEKLQESLGLMEDKVIQDRLDSLLSRIRAYSTI
ncbi:hypothetical protein BS50DRAFT_620231 [Corynespora cassiicola Philippines]|uniref:Zn(2)-C6 fungal-type domain-containing protein n=1 Tax=Corynespora cassiicola Philippines TaxID=1448308 RepID=A0A2T2NRM1_CORCC|nr:hypothetical protein BS50DRAFT_620231 [Corynespora cassiicola Philippines]